MLVQGLWIGPKLSNLHVLCIRSFLLLGYQFDIYVYHPVENMPEGVNVLDANLIVPESFAYKYNDSYASFSNFFRYKLLYDKGGWWVDLDLFLLRPLNFTDEIVMGYEQKNKTTVQIQTNPIKVPPKNEMMYALYRDLYFKIITKILYQQAFDSNHGLRLEKSTLLEKLGKIDYEHFLNHELVETDYNFYELCLFNQLEPNLYKGQKEWTSFGSQLLTVYVKKFGYEKYIKPVHYFNPINWFDIDKFVDPKLNYQPYLRHPDVYIMDLYAQIWKTKNMDVVVPHNCLITHLRKLVESGQSYFTPLCELGLKHKTDKIRYYRHNYTPYYYHLLKDRQYKTNKIFEIGLGYVGFDEKLNVKVMGHMDGKGYQPGASLRMWEEFFPNSEIYGADINRDILFNEGRIKTFYLDQYDINELQNFNTQTQNTKFDVIIDDGSHVPEHQVFTMLYLLDYVHDGGLYIIEDVPPSFNKNVKQYMTEEVLEQIKLKKFEVEYVDLTESGVEDDYLIVLRKIN